MSVPATVFDATSGSAFGSGDKTFDAGAVGAGAGAGVAAVSAGLGIDGVDEVAGTGAMVAGTGAAGVSDGPGPPDRAIEAPGTTGPDGLLGIDSSAANFSAAARVRMKPAE